MTYLIDIVYLPMKNKLYKITGHSRYNSFIYCVVAKTTTQAEEMVANFHKEKDYVHIDRFDSETLATESEYGSPVPLLISK